MQKWVSKRDIDRKELRASNGGSNREKEREGGRKKKRDRERDLDVI
jgi:hypothetical protein